MSRPLQRESKVGNWFLMRPACETLIEWIISPDTDLAKPLAGVMGALGVRFLVSWCRGACHFWSIKIVDLGTIKKNINAELCSCPSLQHNLITLIGRHNCIVYTLWDDLCVSKSFEEA